MPRSPIDITTDLAHYLAITKPGSMRPTHGHAPAPVPYTDTDRAKTAPKLRAAAAEWRQADPEGYAQWRAAQKDDPDAEPCQFCATCRTGGPK
ncbi:hypothetical protein [Streptomyces violaceusniger]|uniref:Uncharacterized protein n=1 Tax=Streptomyces violaceusniger (strain Tu 4113) TaxID=653045 RepID=G2PHN8_STRV4|nr:hypothetical protein [Streptomyces violaceusniger]AEM88839.1 hypothetical protein Strvi_0063 [Streptomyces violaceusniger Tu 4113]